MGKKWLYGKNVIVTGASSGLGRGITKRLIEQYGCNVLGIARSEDKLLALKNELGELSDRFDYKLFDVSSEDNWVTLADTLSVVSTAFKPDVLINNAGILPPFSRIENTTVENMRHVMDINFYSAVYATKHLLTILSKSTCPSIVNIASSSALAPLPGTSIYTASKSALKGFTECMQCEPHENTYIAIVCPGFTHTDIFRSQLVKTDENKLVNSLCMSCDKMVRKIVKGIAKRKRRMIFGLDAKAMDKLYRLMPRAAAKLFAKIMKVSKQDLFKDIFSD